MHPIFDQRRYLIPFRSSLLPQIFTDVLVIGTGVAGLRAAIAAAHERGMKVVALTGRNGGISGVAVSQAVQGYGVEGQGWDEMLAGQRWDDAATIAAIWGTEDEDPTDAQWQAWCELVRRERVWRP